MPPKASSLEQPLLLSVLQEMGLAHTAAALVAELQQQQQQQQQTQEGASLSASPLEFPVPCSSARASDGAPESPPHAAAVAPSQEARNARSEEAAMMHGGQTRVHWRKLNTSTAQEDHDTHVRALSACTVLPLLTSCCSEQTSASVSQTELPHWLGRAEHDTAAAATECRSSEAMSAALAAVSRTVFDTSTSHAAESLRKLLLQYARILWLQQLLTEAVVEQDLLSGSAPSLPRHSVETAEFRGAHSCGDKASCSPPSESPVGVEEEEEEMADDARAAGSSSAITAVLVRLSELQVAVEGLHAMVTSMRLSSSSAPVESPAPQENAAHTAEALLTCVLQSLSRAAVVTARVSPSSSPRARLGATVDEEKDTLTPAGLGGYSMMQQNIARVSQWVLYRCVDLRATVEVPPPPPPSRPLPLAESAHAERHMQRAAEEAGAYVGKEEADSEEMSWVRMLEDLSSSPVSMLVAQEGRHGKLGMSTASPDYAGAAAGEPACVAQGSTDSLADTVQAQKLALLGVLFAARRARIVLWALQSLAECAWATADDRTESTAAAQGAVFMVGNWASICATLLQGAMATGSEYRQSENADERCKAEDRADELAEGCSDKGATDTHAASVDSSSFPLNRRTARCSAAAAATATPEEQAAFSGAPAEKRSSKQPEAGNLASLGKDADAPIAALLASRQSKVAELRQSFHGLARALLLHTTTPNPSSSNGGGSRSASWHAAHHAAVRQFVASLAFHGTSQPHCLLPWHTPLHHPAANTLACYNNYITFRGERALHADYVAAAAAARETARASSGKRHTRAVRHPLPDSTRARSIDGAARSVDTVGLSSLPSTARLTGKCVPPLGHDGRDAIQRALTSGRLYQRAPRLPVSLPLRSRIRRALSTQRLLLDLQSTMPIIVQLTVLQHATVFIPLGREKPPSKRSSKREGAAAQRMAAVQSSSSSTEAQSRTHPPHAAREAERSTGSPASPSAHSPASSARSASCDEAGVRLTEGETFVSGQALPVGGSYTPPPAMLGAGEVPAALRDDSPCSGRRPPDTATAGTDDAETASAARTASPIRRMAQEISALVERVMFASEQSTRHPPAEGAAEERDSEGSGTHSASQTEDREGADSNDEGTEGEDSESSAVNRFGLPDDELRVEVQQVAVTPQGTLLAFVTTRGGLVVYALRSSSNSDVYREQLVVHTVLPGTPAHPHWYELHSACVQFSPDGRFLLAAVQYTPSAAAEGEEATRTVPLSTGCVCVYSMHREDDGDDGSSVKEEDAGVEGRAPARADPTALDRASLLPSRLYGEVHAHTAPVTAARWADPRFWGGGWTSAEEVVCSSLAATFTDGRAAESPCGDHDAKHTARAPAPMAAWRAAAMARLAPYQCFSTGADGIIARWLPSTGVVLQRIRVSSPLQDFVISPLMQAIYSVDDDGQLVMQDVWNETATLGFVREERQLVTVRERGLPASLALLRTAEETAERAQRRQVEPLADLELPDAFFSGTRTVVFDRTHLPQAAGSAQQQRQQRSQESRGDSGAARPRPSGRRGVDCLHANVHPLLFGGRSPAAGGRLSHLAAARSTASQQAAELGRRLIRQVLSRRVGAPRPSQVTLSSSSSSSFSSSSTGSFAAAASASESDVEDDDVLGGLSRTRRYRRRGHATTPHARSSTTAAVTRVTASASGVAHVHYRSGRRLAFVEVGRALCHAGGMTPTRSDPPMGSGGPLYHLLSLSISAEPAWSALRPHEERAQSRQLLRLWCKWHDEEAREEQGSQKHAEEPPARRNGGRDSAPCAKDDEEHSCRAAAAPQKLSSEDLRAVRYYADSPADAGDGWLNASSEDDDGDDDDADCAAAVLNVSAGGVRRRRAGTALRGRDAATSRLARRGFFQDLLSGEQARSSCGPMDAPFSDAPQRHWERRAHHKSAALRPTAANGQYLCLLAAVGPYRMLTVRTKPLEHRPGLYAGLVFDTYTSTVVRVIPVCPVQPSLSLAVNGTIPTHSHARKTPLFCLQASLTVVEPVAAASRGATRDPHAAAANGAKVNSTRGHTTRGAAAHSSSRPVDGAADGAEVLVLTVGGLGETLYVYNALSGDRLRTVTLNSRPAAAAPISKPTGTSVGERATDGGWPAATAPGAGAAWPSMPATAVSSTQRGGQPALREKPGARSFAEVLSSVSAWQDAAFKGPPALDGAANSTEWAVATAGATVSKLIGASSSSPWSSAGASTSQSESDENTAPGALHAGLSRLCWLAARRRRATARRRHLYDTLVRRFGPVHVLEAQADVLRVLPYAASLSDAENATACPLQDPLTSAADRKGSSDDDDEVNEGKAESAGSPRVRAADESSADDASAARSGSDADDRSAGAQTEVTPVLRTFLSLAGVDVSVLRATAGGAAPRLATEGSSVHRRHRRLSARKGVEGARVRWDWQQAQALTRVPFAFAPQQMIEMDRIIEEGIAARSRAWLAEAGEHRAHARNPADADATSAAAATMATAPWPGTPLSRGTRLQCGVVNCVASWATPPAGQTDADGHGEYLSRVGEDGSARGGFFLIAGTESGKLHFVGGPL